MVLAMKPARMLYGTILLYSKQGDMAREPVPDSWD